MNKVKKFFLISAAGMIVAGLIIAVCSMAFVKFDFTELDTMDWQTNTYEIEEAFENIEIHGIETDVKLLPATDGVCKVVCTENDTIYNEIEVTENTLSIIRVDKSKKRVFMSVEFEQPETTVYLPEQVYVKLLIENSSGDIEIPEGFTFEEANVENTSGQIAFYADVKGSLSAKSSSGGVRVGENTIGSLSAVASSGAASVKSATVKEDVSVETSSGSILIEEVACAKLRVKNSSGSIHLSDVKAEELEGENSSGEIRCNNVMVAGDMKLSNTSGGMEIDGCDAANLKLTSSSGSIRGTLLTEKIFVADATSGSVDVPKTTSGGMCEVTTTSGSIKMSIVE